METMQVSYKVPVIVVQYQQIAVKLPGIPFYEMHLMNARLLYVDIWGDRQAQ
jgi:hypothetical protein